MRIHKYCHVIQESILSMRLVTIVLRELKNGNREGETARRLAGIGNCQHPSGWRIKERGTSGTQLLGQKSDPGLWRVRQKHRKEALPTKGATQSRGWGGGGDTCDFPPPASFQPPANASHWPSPRKASGLGLWGISVDRSRQLRWKAEKRKAGNGVNGNRPIISPKGKEGPFPVIYQHFYQNELLCNGESPSDDRKDYA